MHKNILIDIQGNYYTLSGDIKSILENRRFLSSLKRLCFEQKNQIIKIPFETKVKISTLQEIQDLLKKFEFVIVVQDSIKKEISSYHNEQENFKSFADNAIKIKNNEFQQNPELIKNFMEFQGVLKKKMKRVLYPLQMLSSFYMTFSQNSCNFAVPGAGKTSIVYGSYTYLKNLPKSDLRHINKILVIGPLASFAPWENEYKECFGKKITSQRLSGDSKISKNKKIQHLYSDSPKELTLISHAGIKNLEEEIVDFLKKNKTMVVVDEAHRIKNAEGVWGKSVAEIAKEATSRIILTGTPVPNGYEDLYNLFRFIYPFKFQDILKIHYEQLKELTKNTISTEDEKVQNFIKRIKPFFLRIKKNDLKLPDIEEKTIFIEMDDNQRRIYNFIEEKYIKSFKTNQSADIKIF